MSSSGQRSGEVEADESELARPPGRRSCRRERDMVWARMCGAMAASGRERAKKGIARPSVGVELEGVLEAESRIAGACDKARCSGGGVEVDALPGRADDLGRAGPTWREREEWAWVRGEGRRRALRVRVGGSDWDSKEGSFAEEDVGEKGRVAGYWECEGASDDAAAASQGQTLTAKPVHVRERRAEERRQCAGRWRSVFESGGCRDVSGAACIGEEGHGVEAGIPAS